MKDCRSSKRAVTDAASPLEHAGILLHMLNILGPGHHLFISAVSKAWRESCERVASVQMIGLTCDDYGEAALCMVTSQITLCSAAFASASCVRLAREGGLTFDSERTQFIAGRDADVATLQAALELGLELTREVLLGAAEAASAPKLQCLHTDRDCPLPAGITCYAAKGGSVDALRWLKQHGSVFTTDTCRVAAAGAHVHVLQFLRDEGCEWDDGPCRTAAKHGHVATVKWLHEKGCPWDSNVICTDAAAGGSMEVLLYLKQQGCAFNEYTLMGAAWRGQLAICEYLVAEQCPSDITACAAAARGGHLKTIRFLHENGCPWELSTISLRAAESGSVELLQYLKQHDCEFDTETMSFASAKGNTHVCEYLLSEQCPWDLSACLYAANGSHLSTLRWLHEQGCPCDTHAVRVAATKAGHAAILKFMQSFEPAANAAQLTELLNLAGAWSRREAALWLRQQGAEWPAVLQAGFMSWEGDALQWARDEGCTSPTS
jgi:hypothetical protein